MRQILSDLRKIFEQGASDTVDLLHYGDYLVFKTAQHLKAALSDQHVRLTLVFLTAAVLCVWGLV